MLGGVRPRGAVESGLPALSMLGYEKDVPVDRKGEFLDWLGEPERRFEHEMEGRTCQAVSYLLPDFRGFWLNLSFPEESNSSPLYFAWFERAVPEREPGSSFSDLPDSTMNLLLTEVREWGRPIETKHHWQWGPTVVLVCDYSAGRVAMMFHHGLLCEYKLLRTGEEQPFI